MPMINQMPNSTSKRQVLVVDDNEDALLVLRMLLPLKGFGVQTCTSGEQALQLVEENPPEVILLDISMPGMDGYETCRQLRKLLWGKTGEIIALTGCGQVEAIQRAYEVGFNGYLVKPLDLDQLMRLLEKK